MKIVQVKIANFRGIAQGTVHFDGHSVLVGDNNAGKSTLLEAIDLVLGPERLSRRPVIDEHDFYAGQYLNAEGGRSRCQSRSSSPTSTMSNSGTSANIWNGGT